MKSSLFLCTLLLIIALLGNVCTAFAQKNNKAAGPTTECGTPTPSKETINAAEQAIFRIKQTMMGKALPSVVTIPLKIHIVRRSDGTGGASETTVANAVAGMNTAYQPSNIQFSVCSAVHYIDDDNLYLCDVGNDNGLLVLNNVNDAVNIYLVGALIADGSGLNGISDFPSGLAATNRIIVTNTALGNGSTLPHEVGHYFNLYHTHETAIGPELVTRGPGANCTTAGDLVCDTPADPCCYFYNGSTCTYTGTALDANGQPYTPMVNNLMSYYTTCRTQFTTGQQDRMGDGYLLRLSRMQQTGEYVFSCPAVAIAAPTNVSAISGVCSVSLTWTDNSNNEGGFIVERSQNPTTGFVAVGTVRPGVTFFNDLTATPGITTYYRVVAANSNATPSTVVSTSVQAGVCYCVPNGPDCTQGDAIIGFNLRNSQGTLLNKVSACGSNGYSDFSDALSATLTAGQAYTVTVTNQMQYPEGFTIWIDANQDKVFNSNEMVYRSSSVVLQGVQTGSFVLSSTALTGTTRLRIRQSDNSTYPDGGPTQPCNFYTYGETEDYTVVIQPSGGVSSVASGSWASPGTWSTSQLPTAADEVTITTGHTVTIDAITAQAKKVKLNGRINYQNSGKLRVGQ